MFHISEINTNIFSQCAHPCLQVVSSRLRRQAQDQAPLSMCKVHAVN